MKLNLHTHTQREEEGGGAEQRCCSFARSSTDSVIHTDRQHGRRKRGRSGAP